MSRYLIILALFSAGTALAVEPRFALEPGLELRYAVKFGEWFDGKDGKPDIPRQSDGSPKYQASELTVYVLGRQKEGSYRVLMQGTSGADYPVITWADLFTDGRLALIPSAMPTLEFDSLRTVFPLLPKNEQQQAGWEELETRTGVRMRFGIEEGGIKAESDAPLDRVSLGRRSIRFRLHPETHLPDEIQTDARWDKYNETHSILVKAKEAVRHDADWVMKFTAEAEKYFAATATHNQTNHNEVVKRAVAERDKPGAAGELLDAGKSQLSAARDSLNEPLFRDELERLIKRGDTYRQNLVESAQKWSKVAGLPAPLWNVVDLDGKKHSLQDYRGRVVVLDFWFRQCSFCIRAMPQVEQAAVTLQNENAPVSFFGVSVDKEEADARFVADTMKLCYPVLRSEELAEQLGVASFPTLVVIAPDGSVQGIFVGHSLTLREDLTACIRGLLKQ